MNIFEGRDLMKNYDYVECYLLSRKYEDDSQDIEAWIKIKKIVEEEP